MSLARPRSFRARALRRRALVFDVGLATLVAGSVIATAIRDHRPVELLVGLGALPPIFIRTRRPFEALVLAVAAQAVMPANRLLVLPVMAVLYTIATGAPSRTAAAAGSAAAAVAIIAGAAAGSGSVTGPPGGLVAYAISAAASDGVAVALGLYVAAQRRVLEALRERAERLDRERELLAERAVADERLRIAHELHDIVAHNVSLIVVEAQALGATVDDDRVAQRTTAIADLGRQAMSEVHTTLRLLRDDAKPPELTPHPGLGQLEQLIEQSRAGGLEIKLTVEGQRRPLDMALDLSAFRIIQEALTNVIKHAAGASTEVTLAYNPQALELMIFDREPEGRSNRPTKSSDGHGLIGMRERAMLFGGTLSTEAMPEGFRVRATLPYGSSPS